MATSITFKPLHKTFVAEVEGIDWTKPIPDSVIEELQKGIDKYGVLAFRNANLDNDAHVAFSKRFGELDSMQALRSRRFPDQPHIFDVSNLDGDGNIVKRTERAASLMVKGNQAWHADMQYQPRRDKYSILRAVEIPPSGSGGETEYADSRTAYEELDADRKKLVDGLISTCSLMHNRRKAAPELYRGEDPLEWPTARWKAAYPHDGSKRVNLYVTDYTYKFEGMSVEESQKLVDELIAHGTQPHLVYKLPWKQAGDMVMWDNTAVWHRALDDSAYIHKYRRDMRRTNTFDDGSYAWGENDKRSDWKIKLPADPFAYEKTQSKEELKSPATIEAAA